MANSVEYYRKLIGSDGFNNSKEYKLNQFVNNYNNNLTNYVSEFEVLINSERADEVYINLDTNNKTRILIDLNRKLTKTDLNPVTKEIKCIPNTIKTGDYITFKNRYSNIEDTFIVTSKIEKKNGYDLGYMQYCNNFLKFKNKLNKTVQYPIILQSQTLYSDGMTQDRTMIMSDDLRGVLVQYNEDTKYIYLQQRFIFNHNSVFSITMIDDFTYFYNMTEGVLKLTLERDEFNDNDDKVNNLADNSEIPIVITFPQPSYTLTQLSILQLTPTITQGTETLSLPIIYTSDNPTIATVDNTGLITAIGVGNCTITCALADNPSIVKSLGIVVNSSIVTPTIGYVITSNKGLDYITKTSTVTYIIKKFVNNIEDTTVQFTFSVDLHGLSNSSVTATVLSVNSIKIKNNVDSGVITLQCTDNVSGVVTSKVIQLKNIYGN